jgi:hypothetical protein
MSEPKPLYSGSREARVWIRGILLEVCPLFPATRVVRSTSASRAMRVRAGLNPDSPAPLTGTFEAAVQEQNEMDHHDGW